MPITWAVVPVARSRGGPAWPNPRWSRLPEPWWSRLPDLAPSRLPEPGWSRLLDSAVPLGRTETGPDSPDRYSDAASVPTRAPRALRSHHRTPLAAGLGSRARRAYSRRSTGSTSPETTYAAVPAHAVARSRRPRPAVSGEAVLGPARSRAQPVGLGRHAWRAVVAVLRP
jgi:hypothetical protein